MCEVALSKFHSCMVRRASALPFAQAWRRPSSTTLPAKFTPAHTTAPSESSSTFVLGWMAEGSDFFLFRDNFSGVCRRRRCRVPSEPRVFLHLILHLAYTPSPRPRPPPPAHIKSTDDWTRERGGRDGVRRECWAAKSPPTLILSWKWPSFAMLHIFSLLHTWRDRGEKGKAASDVWKAIFAGDMESREPLWWFSFLLSLPRSFATCLDCLRKTASRRRCRVFLSTVHGKFPRKMNLFRHHTCVYILCSLKCHQIFSFTQVFCAAGGGDGKSWRPGVEGIISMKEHR